MAQAVFRPFSWLSQTKGVFLYVLSIEVSNAETLEEMRNMIAFCGLDCGKCDAYIATKNNDRTLREATAELWSKLNNAPILPEHINCEGCRTNGVKTVYCESLCPIRQCALEKGVATCGDCQKMNQCLTLEAVTANNPDARNNLTKE